MNNSRQIKQRIKTAANISKITKAMEMVSASKMKRAQDLALAARPYAETLHESLMLLQSAATTSYLHPLLETHETGQDVLIIVSTDRGLCGNLNQVLFKTTMDWYKRQDNPTVIAVGKKAVLFSRLYGLEIKAQFTDLGDTIELSDIIPIVSLIQEEFVNMSLRSVSLVYMDFINTLTQKVRLVQVLPLPQPEDYSQGAIVEHREVSEYVFEPNAQSILSELLPYYLENAVFHAFLEAKASEHSARMVTMKNASENANELVGELKLLFNKSRQASITNELLDITTAVMSQQ